VKDALQKELTILATEKYLIETGQKVLPVPPDQTSLEQISLSKSRIIFTTLSTGGNSRLRTTCLNKISYLIVDEAC
jgi:hypothetical protein